MMTLALWAAAAICGIAIVTHLVTIAIAIARCRTPARHLPPPADAPAVTLVRPLCGLDNFVEATLRSSFALDYPRFELIFCVAAARDPVVPLVTALIAEHPAVRAKLLVGDERISANPKLNNCLKGWRAAAHDWIVLADSNVLLPRDYDRETISYPVNYEQGHFSLAPPYGFDEKSKQHLKSPMSTLRVPSPDCHTHRISFADVRFVCFNGIF